MKRSFLIGATCFVLVGGGWSVRVGPSRLAAQGRATTQGPAFDVDRLWPKPLPNHWILGSVTGIATDSRDHIWLVHRGLDSLTARTEAGTGTTPPTAEDCCAPAPPVLEFDAAGALVGHWGGPGRGYDWPQSPGGIAVDAKGNVWITAAGPPEPLNAAGPGTRGGGQAAGGTSPPRQDAHVLAFSRTGEFILQIGHANQPGNKDSTAELNRPADIAIDAAANEVYVADGGTSQRVVVFDATTGAHKRHWTGHDVPFARLSSIAVSRDGLVYAGDRTTDRIQVFKKDGTFVTEAFVSKTTAGFGSVWDITFSSDAQQRFLFVADGQDEKIFALDRSTLAVASSFGDGGRWPGTFRAVGSVAMDSKGNLYTGENYEGKRLQKFVKK